jgi:hypothetical protein
VSIKKLWKTCLRLFPIKERNVPEMDVSKLIAEAFAQASHKYASLHGSWIQVSVRVGGLLPHSLLMFSIQRDGSLDLVLRCMEDEAAARMQSGKDHGFHLHNQKMLSEFWVGSVYEWVRLLYDNKRKIGPDNDEVRALKHNLTLLRIPLEKHEIANDRDLNEPIEFQRHPPTGVDTDIYQYAKKDPQRAHIMPSGVSPRGSMMWQVIDVRKNNEECWIERRSLSERIIALWGNQAAPSLEAQKL